MDVEDEEEQGIACPTCGKLQSPYRDCITCDACVEDAQAAWEKRWPRHCKDCRGTGGTFIRNYPHAPDDFEPCEALPKLQTCHRCAKDGLDEDGDGPCKQCGWDYGRGEGDAMPYS
jgi:hypothetical protein